MFLHNDKAPPEGTRTLAVAIVPPGNIVRELRLARGFSCADEASWPEAIYLGFFRLPAAGRERRAALAAARKRFPEAAASMFRELPQRLEPDHVVEIDGVRFLAPGSPWDSASAARAARNAAEDCGLSPEPDAPLPCAAGFPVPHGAVFPVSPGRPGGFAFMRMEAALMLFSLGEAGSGAIVWKTLSRVTRRLGRIIPEGRNPDRG